MSPRKYRVTMNLQPRYGYENSSLIAGEVVRIDAHGDVFEGTITSVEPFCQHLYEKVTTSDSKGAVYPAAICEKCGIHTTDLSVLKLTAEDVIDEIEKLIDDSTPHTCACSDTYRCVWCRQRDIIASYRSQGKPA